MKKEKIICCHCGDECKDDSIKKDDKVFCCTGCLYVHELITDNNLSDVYELTKQSGIKPRNIDKSEFQFLDDEDIKEKMLSFSHNGTSKVVLFVPEIYCSACIWLLENLFRLNKGIIESKVNFLKKEISITFRDKVSSLREIVELLTYIGYQPKLNLSDIEDKKPKSYNRKLYIKLGIAGFCFGNIMLLVLPEYLSGGNLDETFKIFIRYINLVLAIPVLYSASEYFTSAYTSIKLKHINIDVPISLGILVLLIRSVFEISTNTGSGYIDSMSGLVFFLLIGRVFRQKTFYSLSFDRDFKSYFPLSVIRKINDSEQEYISLSKVKIKDTLIIRNKEIIPADSILLSDSTLIDYSFVTGESKAVTINKNEKIYSGGIQIGPSVEIEVVKEFKQSYLTELWNHRAFSKEQDSHISNISNTVAKYFTFGVLTVALGSLIYWLPFDTNIALNSMTAVLIIACPCALALTLPFTYGTTLRVFSRKNFFLKNDNIVEYLAKLDIIIFDKTGTLTNVAKSSIDYEGQELSEEEKIMIKSVVKHSTHPISQLIYNNYKDFEDLEIKDYKEETGKGIEAFINNYEIKIGKYDWVKTALSFTSETFINTNNEFSRFESNVFLSIDNTIYGKFTIKPKYRKNISEMLSVLLKKVKLVILSGDNEKEKEKLEELANSKIEMHFNQLPDDKLNFVENLQKKNKKVMMVGDGLNDAGALKQSDVGIAVTDTSSNFTPSSDAILLADNLFLLPEFLNLSKKALSTVYISFALSFLYNIIGMYFAVQGILSPVIAAILMPISSISVVLFTVSKVKFDAYKLDL